MSTTNKVLIIVGSVMLVCLIAAGIIIGTSYSKIGSNGWFGIFSSQSSNIEESAELDLSGIDTVNVECVSGKIVMAPGEPGADLTGSIFTSNPKEKYLSVKKDGDTLTVKFDADVIFPQTISADVTLSVGLPADAAVNLNISGASANTDLNGFNSLKDVRIDSASGAAHVKDCKGDQLFINLTSGLVDVNGIDFGSVDTGCVSGDINLSGISGSANVTSTSGTVRVSNVLGEVSVNSTSGSVYVTQEQESLKGMHIGVTSGGIDVKLNPKAAFELRANSTSGGVSIDFDVTVSGSASNSFVGDNLSGKVNGGGSLLDLNTTSGGIRVSKISE